MNSVFCSYSRKDKEFVQKIISDLEENNLDLWVDYKDMKVGEKIRNQIDNAINQADFILVFLSNNSVESEWFNDEIDYAQYKRKIIVPVLLNDTDIPRALINSPYIDFRKHIYYEDSLNSLVDVLTTAQPEYAIKKLLSKSQIFKIFICYSSPDTPYAKSLYNRLKSEGYDVWFALEDLYGGDNWQSEIKNAIRHSKLAIVCISKNISRKGYFQKELKQVLARFNKKNNLPYLIPVRFEESEVLTCPRYLYHSQS